MAQWDLCQSCRLGHSGIVVVIIYIYVCVCGWQSDPAWETPAKGKGSMAMYGVEERLSMDKPSIGRYLLWDCLGDGYWGPQRRGGMAIPLPPLPACAEKGWEMLPSHSRPQAQAVCSYSVGPVCTLNSSMAGATSSADDGQCTALSLAHDFWWPCHFSTPDFTGNSSGISTLGYVPSSDKIIQ